MSQVETNQEFAERIQGTPVENCILIARSGKPCIRPNVRKKFLGEIKFFAAKQKSAEGELIRPPICPGCKFVAQTRQMLKIDPRSVGEKAAVAHGAVAMAERRATIEAKKRFGGNSK